VKTKRKHYLQITLQLTNPSLASAKGQLKCGQANQTNTTGCVEIGLKGFKGNLFFRSIEKQFMIKRAIQY